MYVYQKVNKSMEHSLSWEARGCTAGHKILHYLELDES
jgi:predicted SprT family Zn-dependent metalloprotease